VIEAVGAVVPPNSYDSSLSDRPTAEGNILRCYGDWMGKT